MTSLPVLQNRTQRVPDCFGSHLWDPRATECSGGPDVTYTNPKTGSHIRSKCDFLEACGAKVQAQRAAAAQAMVPAQPQFPSPVQPVPLRPMVSASASRQVAPMSQQMQPAQQQMMTPMMMGPWYPASTYQFNHGLPEYLSVPEPQMPGESIWVVLFRSIIRGMIKSTGHTVAHFADVNTIKRNPQSSP